MLTVLALVLPLALAGSVSPVMLSEQTVLLAGADGRRAASRYALGVVGTVVAFVAALLLFGRSISLPADPLLDARSDVVVGLALLLLAVALHLRAPRTPKAHERTALSPNRALAFGVFSMATDVTTLALVLAAVKEVSAGDLDLAERVVVCALLVALVSVPAWLPLVLVRVAPGVAERGLRAVSSLISTHGRVLTVVLLVVLGLFLTGRGAVHLAQGTPEPRSGSAQVSS